MANKGLYVAGGAILVLSAAGIAYWLYEKHMLPQAYISNVNLARSGDGGATVTAVVSNTGKRPGYFKLQAFIVSPSCPYQGSTGSTGTNWSNIETWLNSHAGTGGSWSVGAWQVVNPGQQVNMQAIATNTPIPSGTYNLYVNAAVSKDGTTPGRLKDREYYLWSPGWTI